MYTPVLKFVIYLLPYGGGSTGGDKQCRKVDYKYMYFTEYLITRADVNDFMAHRPEYTKANRFEDFVCKIYL